jgi:glycosyltransferase XagB
MDTLLLLIAVIIIIQSFFTILTMIYAWDESGSIERTSAPKKLDQPKNTFTILLPAYKEEKVIADTIFSIANIDYPRDKFKVLVLLRIDDKSTIAISNEAIKKLAYTRNYQNIEVILVDDKVRNKPNQLNWGLKVVTTDFVTIFDAEDEPSKDILNIANTVIERDQADILQCGVQLMNFRSNWFSTLNVLEYYFWFKSSMLLFAKKSVMPLGGNSVFLRKSYIDKVGGWNENCLTEDAELGFKLAQMGAKTSVMYDPKHTTKEETPDTTMSFIQQRTRWIQGFIQIFQNFNWGYYLRHPLKLILALYILLWPMLQIMFFFYLLLAILIVPYINVSLTVAMVSTFPLILVAIQILILIFGLWQFTRDYKVKFPFWMPFKIMITYLPYQGILVYSAFRAIYRTFTHQLGWEKTKHINAHRV